MCIRRISNGISKVSELNYYFLSRCCCYAIINMWLVIIMTIQIRTQQLLKGCVVDGFFFQSQSSVISYTMLKFYWNFMHIHEQRLTQLMTYVC